jgi:hypothetical protein
MSWALRVAWAVLPLTEGAAVAGALDGRSSPVVLVVTTGIWLGWAVGLVATLVPSTVSLTTIRLLAPGTVVVAVVAAAAGASALSASAAVVGALVAAVIAFSAELGAAYVAAGAYGDEVRVLLRPPGPLVAGPLPLAWAIMAAAAGGGPLLLATGRWVTGGVVTAAAVVLVVTLARRFHRLALRWFVFVPAGVVVRDPLVLADTAMFRRADVAAIGLAPAATTAVDVTGRALGPAVEVSLRRASSVAVTASLGQRRGQAVRADAILVAPSRPGRLVTEARRRGYAPAAVPPPTTTTSPGS